MNESRALVVFHLFRHSAASIVHSVTSDLKLAKELLGHATIATTAEIYTHFVDMLRRELLRSFWRVV